MKKIIALFTLSTLFLTSCLSQLESDSTYTNVYAGIQIYDAALTTHTLALDAPEAAFRLAILLAEMEEQGIEMADGEAQDWTLLEDFEFSYNGVSYNLKEFFFGYDDSVTLQREGNDYYLTFGTDTYQYGTAIFDHYTRCGTFIIKTSGRNLLDTTSTSAWSIELGDEGMIYLSSSDYTTFATSTNLNSNIWYEGDGTIGMVTSNFGSYYESSSTITSSWTSLIYIAISDFTTLALDDIDGATYTVTIDPMTTGTAINGLEMTYGTGGVVSNASTPLLYMPSVNALNAITGTEEVMLTGTYNEYLFPSPFVEIVWEAGCATVYYDGYSYDTSI